MMKWNLKYIQSLIDNKIEESLNLDYKAGASLQRMDKKTAEISKDVSAFANSDGGIIIYGIKEDEDNRHLPGSIDPIDRTIISKEWLEQIIQSKIRPRIDGIVITPIEVNENKVIYVVEISKSNTAHQADDKKYYKRFNFNSEPMYDYEIRDILNRSTYAKIDLEFHIKAETYEVKNTSLFPSFPTPSFTFDENGRLISEKLKEPEKEYKTDYTLIIRAKNSGNVLANYINAYIKIDSKYLVDERLSKQGGVIEIFADNTIRDVVDSTYVPSVSGGYSIPKYGPSRYDPILPRQSMQIDKNAITSDCLVEDSEISWVVYVDNAEPRTGSISIKDIEVVKKNLE